MLSRALITSLVLLVGTACGAAVGDSPATQAGAAASVAPTPALQQHGVFAEPLLTVSLAAEYGQGSTHGAIVWSPDSTRFAMGVGSGVWLFDDLDDLSASTGRLDGPMAISRVAFSPDGRFVASASGTNIKPAPDIALYDAATGELLRVLQAPDDGETPSVMDVALTNETLIALTSGGAVLEFAIETGELLRDFDTAFDQPKFVAISPDGAWIAHGSARRNGNPALEDRPALHLIDAESGAVSDLNGQTESIRVMLFLRDGRLATISTESVLTIWDPAMADASEPSSSVALAAGVFDAVVLDDGTLAGVHPFTGAIDPETGVFEQHPALGILSPDGAYTVHRVSTSDGSSINLRDAGSAKVLSRMPFNSYAVTWLESTAPSIVAADFPGGADLDVLDLTGGQTAAVAGAPGTDSEFFHRVAHAPDGKLAAGVTSTFSGNADISVFDTANGELIRTLTGHLTTPATLAFSQDGTRLLSRGNTEEDSTVRVWDVETGGALTVLRADDLRPAAALSPDGATIVTANGDLSSRSFALRVWDADTGELRHEIGLDRLMTQVAFSPDGRVLAVAGDLSARFAGVQFFDGETFDPLSPLLKAGESLVADLVFSDDGARLLTGIVLGDLLVWDVEARQIVAVIEGTGGGFSAYDFLHGSSSSVVASDATGILRIWEIAEGE